MRRDVSKQVKSEYESLDNQTHVQSSRSARRFASVYSLDKPTQRMLPPLQRVPQGSRSSLHKRQSMNNSEHSLSKGSHSIGAKVGLKDRLLPTQVKESFLDRNKHVAQARM